MTEPTPAPTPTPDPAPAPPATPAPAPTIAAASEPPPAVPPAPAPAAPPAAPGAPQGFPADWRAQLAGDDKTALAQLDRFASPAELHRSYRALQQRLSSGELRATLAPDASDEQRAAWRKENGLPEKPEGYVEKLALPDGVVLADADKVVVSDFAAKIAHKHGLSQSQVNDVVGWYYGVQDAQALAREEADLAYHRTHDDALRAEWGADYRPNVNAVSNLIARMPGGLGERLLTARIDDPAKPGASWRLGDDPHFIRFLAQVERELNPAATLVPAGAGDGAKALADRKAELQVQMRDRSSDYWRGPRAEAMQQEYRDIVAAEERIQKRSAA